jgi:DNA repair exonuclease SbcCD nuclease subunit
MKFVHAADLHLDSPLRGLERYEGAPVEQIRGATRRALQNLVELCIEERAELLLIAGDLYDDDWRDYSTGLFFASQMARLREAGIEVVWIRGNHDAASKLTRHLRLPENVHELATRRPDKLVLEQLGVVVHGQGFASPAITDDLTQAYPQAIASAFNIGLLHTALEGREGHAPYAPCKLEALINKGYDYWALGHVHQREILNKDPWIAFPGNLQGRHARETGAKGALLVNVEAGRVTSVEHRALDDVRWFVCDVDASAAHNPDDVLNLVSRELAKGVTSAEGRLLATRVRVRGTTAAHSALQASSEHWIQEVRSLALDAGGAFVWIEKVQFATHAAMNMQALRERDDALGELLRDLRTLRDNDAELESLTSEFSELKRKLPAEFLSGADAVAFSELSELRGLLDEVEDLLVPKLSQMDEELR